MEIDPCWWMLQDNTRIYKEVAEKNRPTLSSILSMKRSNIIYLYQSNYVITFRSRFPGTKTRVHVHSFRAANSCRKELETAPPLTLLQSNLFFPHVCTLLSFQDKVAGPVHPEQRSRDFCRIFLSFSFFHGPHR